MKNPIAFVFGGVFRYLKESRDELVKVIWPTPESVIKNTAAVIAFSFVIGIFILFFDFVFTMLVKTYIIK